MSHCGDSSLVFGLTYPVTKLPILAIETEGYSYHNESTEQHKRDLMKDHILSCYGLPLLRLSTKGSNEKERVIKKLDSILSNSIATA